MSQQNALQNVGLVTLCSHSGSHDGDVSKVTNSGEVCSASVIVALYTEETLDIAREALDNCMSVRNEECHQFCNCLCNIEQL